MAPWLFKEMKGVNFSCASPASAAICTSIDHKSMVRPSAGRAIDRHTPHLRDPRRAKAVVNSMSQAPTRSKPSYHQKSSRSFSLEEPAADELPVRTPASSARYLLNDDAFIDVFPDLEAAPSRLLAIQLDRPKEAKKEDGSSAAFQSCSSSVKKHDQVVVLRVSLHCKGCEGKVRKHISRMEGVTSFNIDFSTKKVTVVGDVTPLGVLNSISKVKNAQLWPSTAAPPSSMPPQPPSSA